MLENEIMVQNAPEIEEPANPFMADYQQSLIMQYVEEFQDSLDDDHEIGLYLANFGSETPMIVTEIGFENPMLIIFYGFVNGTESVLIQNINQINFLLTSVEKADPEKPARRIGFTDSRMSDSQKE